MSYIKKKLTELERNHVKPQKSKFELSLNKTQDFSEKKTRNRLLNMNTKSDSRSIGILCKFSAFNHFFGYPKLRLFGSHPLVFNITKIHIWKEREKMLHLSKKL